jgi:acetyltransferase-like isoleucine patch superfamily enzyme
MSIISRYRNWIITKKKTNQLNDWRKKGIIVPDSFMWEDDIRLDLSNPFFDIPGGSIVIGENVKISKGVIIDCFGGRVIIGDNVFIGPYTVIYGHGGVTIGNDSLIGMGCKIISANHTIPAPDKLIRLQPDRIGSIIINQDVWLGADVKVLADVEIGSGVIIGANSVINKSILSFSIAAGTPAKIIGQRESNYL